MGEQKQMSRPKTLEQEMPKMQERLLRNIGEHVAVEFVWFGTQYATAGKLEKVDPYKRIRVGNAIIPFKADAAAIQNIYTGQGVSLYKNPEIKGDHGFREESFKEGFIRYLRDKNRPRITDQALVTLSTDDTPYIFKAILKAEEPTQKGKHGGWIISIPTLEGCISQGETKKEAIENIRDAAKSMISALKEDNKPIPLENLT